LNRAGLAADRDGALEGAVLRVVTLDGAVAANSRSNPPKTIMRDLAAFFVLVGAIFFILASKFK
jgi:hypothetical protein